MGTLRDIVVMAQFFQLGIDIRRILVGPVGKQDRIFAIVFEGFWFGRIDDDGAIQTGLLLETGMTVVPVGATLQQRKAVGEGFARGNTAKAVGHIRHAIHCTGQDDAMPVNGTGFLQMIGHAQRNRVALTKTQRGRRQGSVDRSGHGWSTGEIDGLFADRKIEDLSAKGLRPTARLAHGGIEQGGLEAQARHQRAGGCAEHETAARQVNGLSTLG